MEISLSGIKAGLSIPTTRGHSVVTDDVYIDGTDEEGDKDVYGELAEDAVYVAIVDVSTGVVNV